MSLWDQLGCIQELADVIARPLFVIFKSLWPLWEASQDREKSSITPILKMDEKKDIRELQADLQPSPGKMMEQIIIETVSKHIKDKKGWWEQLTWV